MYFCVHEGGRVCGHQPSTRQVKNLCVGASSVILWSSSTEGNSPTVWKLNSQWSIRLVHMCTCNVHWLTSSVITILVPSLHSLADLLVHTSRQTQLPILWQSVQYAAQLLVPTCEQDVQLLYAPAHYHSMELPLVMDHLATSPTPLFHQLTNWRGRGRGRARWWS